MSVVTHVPETHELDGDDVRQALTRAEYLALFRDAFIRFRYADGFSYARSMAFQLVLTIIPGIALAVAVAARLGEGRFQSALRSIIESLAAGPAGDVLLRVFEQGNDVAALNRTAVIVTAAIVTLVSAATSMAQFQRGASRIYGVMSDRPTVRRYAHATVLALSVGILLTIAFVALVLGGGLYDFFGESTSWLRWGRWVVGLIILPVAIAALYRAAPNRRQPAVAWLTSGSTVGVVLWFLVSWLLALYLNASTTFGQTYGPLAGVIGFMMWAQLSSIALLYGLAVAAELEADRAGVDEPTRPDPTNGEATDG